ncbi:PAS domain S-box protein [Methanolobus mangrovi]|uniref:histidine kinase n=1 Tax=Methanolobus mangrovi TaxID=3072977 RepID=A0AA51YI81_9EURY|nr:PAS domain S-box protein [Methanolobus mangrovi]WMW21258.1 PAS domain S-box protein [Methanolobus mangrovi]
MRYISSKTKAGNTPEKEQSSRRCELADINKLSFQKINWTEREITIELLNLFNKSNHLEDIICSVIELLKNWSDCEAVGIRLKDGDDYPYYQTQGFPDSFITSENSLCVHGINGQILKDKIGNPVLECMCGNVISERTDPQMSFFTQMGSFWTGSTSELLANTSEEERQARTRNRCNGEGYESVALIPLRADKVTFGLIQLNDHRKDVFTAESIALLECIADSIALALTQKKAKEELQLSEQRLKSIFKVAPVGIGVVSNRILTEVNSLVCEMTGYTGEELIGSTSQILYPTQEEFEFVGKEKYQQINKKGTGTVETRWKRKDGTIINVLLSSTPIDVSDQSKGVTFTALDITERKQAEISLRESEEKFREQAEKNRAIINTIPDMLFVIDKDGYYREYYSNDRTKISYIPERIIGANISDIYPVEEAIRLIKACRECISTNKLQTIEYQYQNKGKKMFFEARLSPIYNNHALAVVRDITETKNSQETLRTIAETGVSSEEDIFRILVRQLAVSQNIRYSILAEIHPEDPNTAHTIAVWNGDEYAENFSYELKNTPCKDVTHKGSCFYPSNIQELFPDDHLLKEMEAESYWGTPLKDSAGRSIGLLIILDDRPMEHSANTHSMLKSFAARAAAELERRRTEEALLYSKIVADDINRIKSEFMKNVSHELRTPLTAVIGFSDVLLNHNSEGLSESQKTHINHIHNSGQNLLDLINKILDFSKYEIDDLETISLKELSLDSLISEIMMLMSQRASNKNINISFKRKDSIGIFYADEDKLTQIIHNLLDNAVKFTKEGGSVSIETRTHNKMLQVSIVDTGIGIEKEHINSIFKPFVQIDGSIARKYNGTGIGLALTKKFVDLHGGNIWVSSEPGKGSNFTFEIPIDPN